MVLRFERGDGRGAAHVLFFLLLMTFFVRLLVLEIGKVTYILMELYELWPTVTYAELRPTLLKIRQKYQPGLQTTAMSAQG